MPRKDRDDFEDDDDRPRPRRRRPRDDDDEPRPRRAGPKKAGGPNKLVILVVGLTVLAVATLGCAGLLALKYFATPAKAPAQNPGQVAGPSAGPSLTPEQEAKNRETTRNNMTQISIGMHNQSDVEGGKFQGPFAPGSVNGGHSFRVGLLRYVEQETLLQRIDLTQPWDSERNAQITNAIVPGYLDPTNPASVGTATPYRMFVGPGAVFEGKAYMPRVVDVPDGTSNTILYVQAAETVPWAKPQELPFGPGVALPPLGSPQADGFFLAMADGSVRYLKKKVSEATLRSLIEKADGRGAGLE